VLRGKRRMADPVSIKEQYVTKTEKAIIEAAYAWERKALIEEVFFHGPAYRLMKAVLADKRAKKGAKK
jgi:hypothetical protein